jgi:hypothetical protein
MPLAGAVAGIAMLLRPEAIWYVAGLAAAVGPRRAVALACGAAAAAAPYALANLVHFGNMSGPHLSIALSPLRHDWIAERIQRIDTWLIPESIASASGLLLIVASGFLGAVRVALVPRQVIGLAGAALVALAAGLGGFSRESFWQACPIAALALVPSGRFRSLNALWLVVLVCSAGILLSATNDGGAQWGPRFLLIVAPAVIVIAADTCTSALAAGDARLGRRLLIALVMVGCLATTRLAYRELRGSKQMYARLVAATESLTQPEAPIVFNVWWFDQVTASLHGRRTFLYVRSPSEASDLLRTLRGAGTASAALVWTDEPDGQSLAAAVAGTCFDLQDVEKVSVRAVRLASVRCR